MSLTVTCKHHPEGQLPFSVRRRLQKSATAYPRGLSSAGHAITGSLFANDSQNHSFTGTIYIFLSFLSIFIDYEYKETAPSRDKDEALLIFPVYYLNLYFCHNLLSCLGTYKFFQGKPHENMTTAQ